MYRVMTTSQTPAPVWCDVHIHPFDMRFAEGADAVVERARRGGVVWLLASAVDDSEWDAHLELARRHAGVFCALGIHPWRAACWTPGAGRRLAGLLADRPEIAAIGEIGLDFHDGRADAACQIEIFSRQLALARRFNRPVILHNRSSWNECFALLRNEGLPRAGGVCHAFSASCEIARQALDLGLYLSFGGMVTHLRNRRCREAVRFTPGERLLVETDAPCMPVAGNATGMAQPDDLSSIYAAIAEIREMTVPQLADRVAETIGSLFPDHPPAG